MKNNDSIGNVSLKTYYYLLQTACVQLEINPDNEIAIETFTDAAYKIAKANCAHLFPDDLYVTDVLDLNAAKTPEEGIIITSVAEVEENAVQ